MPQPSHWLMHLVMAGRDVLGITGFNFLENPVTPHTSFVNSLQPFYTYPQVCFLYNHSTLTLKFFYTTLLHLPSSFFIQPFYTYPQVCFLYNPSTLTLKFVFYTNLLHLPSSLFFIQTFYTYPQVCFFIQPFYTYPQVCFFMQCSQDSFMDFIIYVDG